MRITSVEQLTGQLISTARPCPSLPLADFLRRAHGKRRVHWENAREELAFAGYGATVDLIAEGPDRYNDVHRLARQLFDRALFESEVEPLLVGGFSFNADFKPQVVWAGMAAAQFVLPEVMIRRQGDQSWLILSRYIPDVDNVQVARDALDDDLDILFDDLFWNFSGEIWNPEWEEASDIEYPMRYDDWSRMINNATGQMKRGNLNKVVLSRMAQIRFSNPVNVVRALEYLRDAYPGTHRFLFEPEPHNAFYGATPETLVKVERQEVFADGLAGTIKRGRTPEEDDALAAQILNDPKERREHEFVVQGLREHLAPFTETLRVDDTPGVLKLSNVQHLHTPVAGKLKMTYGVLPLVAALHPTPALGGQPRDAAEDVIRTLEPITRGWYAAPVGWMDRDDNGHFVVGIRAAVTRERTLWAYAGAGIVAESQPGREWNETNLKFKPMLHAVGITHAQPRAES